MLRTNSKELKNKINNYIIDNFYNDDFKGNYNDLDEVKEFIINKFIIEKLTPNYKNYYKSKYEAFKSWAQGLPSVALFDYYYTDYYRIVDIVGDLLEQTETEREKYDNEQASELLTKLIYREIFKEVK